MVGTLGTDDHQNLGNSRQQQAAMDNLDAEIRVCKECTEDDLCQTHRKAWKQVHGSEPK